MRTIAIGFVLVALTACSQQESKTSENAPATGAPESTAPAVVPDVPAGEYKLDPTHASLIFRVNHLGFSNYTARFKKFDATLQFDPVNPAQSQVTATVDPRSIETDFPDPAKHDFNAALQGPQWLDAAQFPEMTLRSTKIEMTGPSTADIHGDFTLHGVTKPLVLKAKFNGGFKGMPQDPRARIGFSANGSLKRSEFGIAYGVPAPGTTMGVGDDVEIIIEAEFTGPPMTAPSPAQ